MTTTHSDSHRRGSRTIDIAGLLLLLCGLLFGFVAYILIQELDFNALVVVPSVVATTIGATHLTKVTAPRD